MNRENVASIDPEVMGGAPVFTGTRVPVESLAAHLKAGDALEDFLEGFPSVTREQAEAFQWVELDRRLVSLDANPEEAIPWEYVQHYVRRPR